jgi:hypothetical protein
MSPAPIATAGSLQDGQSAGFLAQALDGNRCVPGATIWLYEISHVSGDSMTVPAGQCGNHTSIGTTPIACTTNLSGNVAITYTVPPTIPDAGTLEVQGASTSATKPTISASNWYLYEVIYQFSTSPIAPNGSLTAAQPVTESLLALGVGGTPAVGFPVFLSLTSTAVQSGGVTVGTTPLTSTPQEFFTDGTGYIQMTYTTPPGIPTSGIDTISAESDLNTTPAVTSTTSYDFTAGDPVISVGDEAQVEGDAQPHIYANFDLTLSAPQSQPVSVEYITVCGTGDKTCKEDYLQSLKPVTLTFTPGVDSMEISVKIYSYPADEPYNESYFVQLLKPTVGVLGRSMAQGTILGDDETTLHPILYIGDTSVVCGDAGLSQTADFTVTLSSAETNAVAFDYASQDGSAHAGIDYDAVSGVGTISPGQTSLDIQVPILPNPDTASTTTYMVNITSPLGAVIERATGVGTILNWTAQ